MLGCNLGIYGNNSHHYYNYLILLRIISLRVLRHFKKNKIQLIKHHCKNMFDLNVIKQRDTHRNES